MKCCFFYLCQNIYRNIQAEGLTALYNGDDRSIKIGPHLLCALTFVAEDKVVRNLRDVRDHIPKELEPIVDYLEKNYIR